MNLSNQTMKEHQFLQDMYSDGYFPDGCVDKVKEVLVRLCLSVEAAGASLDLDGLYRLTHASRDW